ncbi:MAG: tetratricopeptide repeat protein [Pararhodobacter sp.]
MMGISRAKQGGWVLAFSVLAAPALAQETDCDILAGYSLIPRIEGAGGVYAIRDAPSAIAACEAAMAEDPDEPFFAVLLARSLTRLDPADDRIVPLLMGAYEGLPALAGAELGRVYEFGLGGQAAGEGQARNFYRLACEFWPDRQAGFACTQLGVMRIEGRGGEVDEESGFALLGTLCGDGWGPACTELAFHTDLRGIGSMDEISAQIAPLFEAGCEAGDLQGCSQFGFRLELGEGVPMDVARAKDLYETACSGGEPQGCSYLGEVYRSGLGVQPDIEEAVRLFTLGCAGDDSYACVTLGDILAGGRGVPVDRPRALAVLEHACWLGDPEGCDAADRLR